MFTIETPTALLAEALTLEPGYTGVSWAGFGTLGRARTVSRRRWSTLYRWTRLQRDHPPRRTDR